MPPPPVPTKAQQPILPAAEQAQHAIDRKAAERANGMSARTLQHARANKSSTATPRTSSGGAKLIECFLNPVADKVNAKFGLGMANNFFAEDTLFAGA